MNVVRADAVIPTIDRSSFVETQQIAGLTAKALRYLNAGYAVHLRGPAGTGKSSLAMHVAARIGRPVVLLLGDEEFGSRDLVGSQSAVRHRKVVDQYVHTVTKTDDVVTRFWVDSRLTAAVKNGYTLVYDEFTRSRAETNNPLLSILEERVLTLPPDAAGTPSYIPVHEEFRAIFTSNPEEYAGVHRSQDALQDRMITLDIDGYDKTTEAAIVAKRSQLSLDDAAFLVELVHAVHANAETRSFPTLRSSIMLARIVERADLAIDPADERFRETFLDVIISEASRQKSDRSHRERVARVATVTLREAFLPNPAPAPPQQPPASPVAVPAPDLTDRDGLTVHTVKDIQFLFRER